MYSTVAARDQGPLGTMLESIPPVTLSVHRFSADHLVVAESPNTPEKSLHDAVGQSDMLTQTVGQTQPA
ncbi:hypothetical protein C8Q74DRAFT_437324 [Fomes fomentarius]|nr:hypothetical protein C8Q74DRAFT_437324 [Fomes fomentarius]